MARARHALGMSEDENGAFLNPQQERFCQELMLDDNQTQAAIRAGYSEDSATSQASRLLTKANVWARVDQLRTARARRLGITGDTVLSKLDEVVERCLQREPVMVREGREMVQETDEHGRHVWKFDASGANTALGILAKHLGLLTEKVEHSGPGGGPIQFTDHEAAAKLAAILNAARARKDAEPAPADPKPEGAE